MRGRNARRFGEQVELAQVELATAGELAVQRGVRNACLISDRALGASGVHDRFFHRPCTPFSYPCIAHMSNIIIGMSKSQESAYG